MSAHEETMTLNNQEEAGSTLAMTVEQAHIILDFMATHTKFMANQAMGCDPKKTKEKLCKRLQELVNAIGPFKTTKQIQKWFSSIKSKAKKYNGQKKVLLRATGNPQKKIKANPRYDKVLTIVGTNHGNGLPLIQEDGFTQSCESDAATYVKSLSSEASSPTVTATTASVSSMAPRNLEKLPLSSSKTRCSTVTSGQWLSKGSKLVPQPILSTKADVLSTTMTNATFAFANTEAKTKYSPTKDDVFKNTFKHGITNRTVFENVDVKVKAEPVERMNEYMQHLKGLASSRSKPNFTQMRTIMTMKALDDGTSCMKDLTNAIVQSNTSIAEVHKERNLLLKEQNKLLAQLLKQQQQNKEN